jgi:hypothetical protein
LVFWFLVLRFWGYCHSLHITSFQIYLDNEQGLYYLCVCVIYIICMCVLKDMTWYKRLWGGSSGGVPYVDIDAYTNILHHTVFQNGLAGLQITSIFPIFSGAVWAPRSSMCHPTNIDFFKQIDDWIDRFFIFG